MNDLVGKGVYTPGEASKLLGVSAAKIVRWLKGHSIGQKFYEPLWRPEISLGDERIFLGFRDLMEIRVANAFIKRGLPPVRVRNAIKIASDLTGNARPLSTNRFRTDGREIFFHIIETSELGEIREKLLNLFRNQYEFKSIIDPILQTIDFDERGDPKVWWPLGRRANIVVDPDRAFGQPIDNLTSVPTSALAQVAKYSSISQAMNFFEVPESSVRRAIDFETQREFREAA